MIKYEAATVLFCFCLEYCFIFFETRYTYKSTHNPIPTSPLTQLYPMSEHVPLQRTNELRSSVS